MGGWGPPLGLGMRQEAGSLVGSGLTGGWDPAMGSGMTREAGIPQWGQGFGPERNASGLCACLGPGQPPDPHGLFSSLL